MYYPLKSWNIFNIKQRKNWVFSQFEIIINVLVSFRFICILMLWVYGHYKIVYSNVFFIKHNKVNINVFDFAVTHPLQHEITTLFHYLWVMHEVF